MNANTFAIDATREMVVGRLKSAGTGDPDVLRGIVDGMPGQRKPMKFVALAGPARHRRRMS